MSVSGLTGLSYTIIASRVGAAQPARDVASADTRASRFVPSDPSASIDDPLRYERAVRGQAGPAPVQAAASPGVTADGAVNLAQATVAVSVAVPAPQIAEAARQAQSLTRFAAAWSDLPGYVAAVISGSVKLPSATTVV